MAPASAIQPSADQAPRRSDTDRAIAAAIESLRDNFLAMRQRINADRAVADTSGAE